MSNNGLGPWYAWYPEDFENDAGHLSRSDECSYRRLLDRHFLNGGWLPSDDAKLAYYAKCTPREWERTRAVLAPFFDIDQSRWTQKRAVAEFERAQAIIEKRRQAARTRWNTNLRAVD